MIEMSTIIRVSKWLVEALGEEKKAHWGQIPQRSNNNLLREKRKRLAEKYFGVDKNKISEFVEKDRLDSRI